MVVVVAAADAGAAATLLRSAGETVHRIGRIGRRRAGDPAAVVV
jgi:phosphoribosylformylglycinamidine cyclo-ligase